MTKMKYLYLLICIVGIGLFVTNPIPQPLSYHNFADNRSWFGIPNFNDVISNLPFILLSILEIHRLIQRFGRIPFRLTLYNESMKMYEGFMTPHSRHVQIYTHITFLVIGIWVGLGSAYYHWAPDNFTLIWDRLPMAVAFMLLLTFVLLRAGVISFDSYLRTLTGLQIIGIGSVVIWAVFDDLRLYGLVQFGSILAIVGLLIRGGVKLDTKYLWSSLLLYLIAKAAEHYDRTIFAWSLSMVSGHTLKHLLAAMATYFAGRVMVV